MSHRTKNTLAILFGLLYIACSYAFTDVQNVTITNHDNESVNVTLNCIDGGHSFSVDAISSKQTSVNSLNSITINGQTLNIWQNGSVTLPDNTTISVSWQQDPVSNSTIVIMDSGHA